MAKLEQKLIGDFDQIVNLIEDGIKSGSVSPLSKTGVIFWKVTAGVQFVYSNDIVMLEEIDLV